MPFIVHTTTGFPPYYYTQAEVTAMLRQSWARGYANTEQLEQIQQNMMVEGRYLALPIDEYRELSGFGVRNDHWIRIATDLGEEIVCRLLENAGIGAEEISQLATTSVTGIAVPSLDARLMNRIPFNRHLKRMPLFGLGCAGGAAGVARLADALRGYHDGAGILLSVELCSLTLQMDDLSIANVVASGLFGDGAAAMLMVGDDHPLARPGLPQVVDSRACFFPDTEGVMGWDIGDRGFRIVLNAAVPELARQSLPPAIASFLATHDLTPDDIARWLIHPGGPKVLEALEDGLGLAPSDLALSWRSLAEVGNLSSASVLWILQEVLAAEPPPPGSYGLMMAMGPAFCAELVLLRW